MDLNKCNLSIQKNIWHTQAVQSSKHTPGTQLKFSVMTEFIEKCWRHSLKKASSFSKKAKYLKTLLSLAHHQTRAVWTDWPQNWLTTKLTDHHYQPCTFTIGDKKKWGRLKLKRQSVKQNSCLPNDQLADRSPSSLLTKEKTSDISKQSSF